MSTTGGPRLAGIGRTSGSNLILCADARDLGSYPGEPTTNELFDSRTLLDRGWGSGNLYPTKKFPIAPTVAYSSTPNSFTGTIPVPGKIEFGTYWDRSFWQGDINLGVTRAFSAGTKLLFSGWYLPWTSQEAAIIAAGRGLGSNTLGIHMYTSLGGGGTVLDVKPVAGGSQPVNGFNHWWYFEFLYTVPSGGITGNARIEDRGWDYYYNNSGSAGGSEVYDVEYYWCNVQIEQKGYRTPVVRTIKELPTGGSYPGISAAHARPATTSLMIHGNVGTGTTFKDSSPSKHTITASGHTTHSNTQSKFAGGSIYFDGNGDYLTIPDSSDWDFGSGEFTIDAWIYPTSMTDSSGNSGTIICQDDNSSSKAWNIRLNSNATLLFRYTTDGANEVDLTSSATGITINNWYHIAVVRRENTCAFYVNGIQKGTSTLSATIYSSSTSVNVGARASGNLFFTGYMDEIRVTKGVALWLRTYQMNVSAENLRCPDGPVVDLSGSNSVSLPANAGNFSTGDMTDVRTYNMGQVIKPLVNAFWDFDGTDDYIDFGDVKAGLSAPNFYTNGTVCVWVNPADLDSNRIIWSKNQGGGGGTYVTARIMSSKVNFALYGNWGWSPTCATLANLVIGTWTHLAFTWYTDGLALYRDGVLQAAQVESGTWGGGGSFPFWLGSSESNQPGDWNGQMAALEVYRTKLTAAEIKQNFNAQRGRFGV